MSHRMPSVSRFASAHLLMLCLVISSILIGSVALPAVRGQEPAAPPSLFLEENIRTPAATTAAIGMAMSVGGQPAFAGTVLNPRFRTVWLPEEDNTQPVVGL